MQNSIYCYMASQEQASANSASILPFHHLGIQRGLEAPCCSTAPKQPLCTSCGPNFITLHKENVCNTVTAPTVPWLIAAQLQ